MSKQPQTRIRHEYRITASAEDTQAQLAKKTGLSLKDLPDFDRTWYSHNMYDFEGNRTADKRKSRMTAREAAFDFWEIRASKWPSAKMHVTQVITTTGQIFPESSQAVLDRANGFTEDEKKVFSPGAGPINGNDFLAGSKIYREV